MDCVNISLVASSFKHINQAVVGDSRASQAFVSFLQCSSLERIKNYYNNCLSETSKFGGKIKLTFADVGGD